MFHWSNTPLYTYTPLAHGSGSIGWWCGGVTAFHDAQEESKLSMQHRQSPQVPKGCNGAGGGTWQRANGADTATECEHTSCC
eukprot:1184882-Prorocentrum_minimum.AAC.3